MEPTKLHQGSATGANRAPAGKVLESVAEAVERLRFGAIQLTIHDGKVVQLDVTERQRFT